MMKPFKYQSVLVLVGIILLLGGCTGEPTTPKDAFKKSEKAMKKLNSVQVEQEEFVGEVISNNQFKMDLENDAMIYEHKAGGTEITVQGDEAIVRHSSGSVGKESNSKELKQLKEASSFQLAPLDIFEELNEDIIDDFVMEIKDNELVLTFDKGKSEELATQLYIFLSSGLEEISEERIKEIKELNLDELSMEIVIDKSDYLLKNMTISMQTEMLNQKKAIGYNYKYSKYDEEIDIKPAPKTTNDIDIEEATAYLEAIIAATVYQDLNEYMRALPQSMKGPDNKNSGKLERDHFRELYIESKKQIMSDYVKKEEFELLADAFFDALKNTKYKIVSTEVIEGNLVATLSIEGINEGEIYQETEEEITEIFDKEMLSIEELALRNIELLKEAYKASEITEPETIQVNVNESKEGYKVLLQDEFLLEGFVQ